MRVISDNYKKIIKARKEGKYMIGVNTQGVKSPFFAIPGIIFYNELIPEMDKDQPFYCFELCPYTRVEDTASLYISEMRKVQPVGPYNLCGYCAYGIIAYEMAQQLLKQGEKVSVLILVDAALNLIRPKNVKPIKRLFALLLFYLEYYKRKLQYYNKVIKPLPYIKKASFISKETLRYLRNRGMVIYRRITKRYNKQYQHKEPYTIKPYPGTVTLFKSKIPMPNFSNDPYMGWSRYVTGEIKVYNIEGDHTSMCHQPAVKDFAKKIRYCLEHQNAGETNSFKLRVNQ
ncbi:MAG: hypothetical protein ICV79_23865 [Flavisolibacter sp.]|nr:hypothetical protein [Flavisolibacter sp.]